MPAQNLPQGLGRHAALMGDHNGHHQVGAKDWRQNDVKIIVGLSPVVGLNPTSTLSGAISTTGPVPMKENSAFSHIPPDLVVDQ
jgi:hypothetical protein